MDKEPQQALENTGRLCSIYCPGCKAVINKISFNLLREAGTVEINCSGCGRITRIEYDGKVAKLWND
jgi:RNase P subunit RPR2